MATEKGLFKDDLDRHTAAHQKLCSWFLDNADLFVRRFLYDRPAGVVSVVLEELVTDKTFLIGYADVLLRYTTDEGVRHCVLIEAKSRLIDFGAALRQMRTYCRYLPEITKSCLVHSDEQLSWFTPKDYEMRRFFGSQGIYVEFFGRMECNYFNMGHCGLPSGRREARIRCVHRLKSGPILMAVTGIGFDEHGADADDDLLISVTLSELEELATNLGADSSSLRSLDVAEPFTALDGYTILADVEHPVGLEGYPVNRTSAVHAHDLSWTISLNGPQC